ncbi:hypothetical protein J2T09_005251 [Neorhizobium huautlense]|uniref:HEAT repeat domain-containing protein n=1 Tax=Neorhizobium huautlense TaxID=67774 RepID=A0ABT9Q176_9HYPH|nr:hypothetical protein [Neorhizobium huautlense]MDP9840464.1 hypothetical protein [Neorhizobium huautlense]
MERLATAVFWAEAQQERQVPNQEKRQRLDWLIGVIESAIQRHADVLPLFLKQLHYKGDDPDFADGLLAWLHSLQEKQIPGPQQDRIEAAKILIGGLAPWTGSILPPLLDHPSDHVRACAACVLGRSGQGFDEEDDRSDRAFFAALTEKEIERPGIAGPYWSGTGLMYGDWHELDFDVVDWMLDIIERRRGPEPEDMPFNGIDFHIHELAAGDPQAVRRMIAAGNLELAVMTATELQSRVEVMIPILSELSEINDQRIAAQAQIHLAHFYGILHHRTFPERIRCLENWRKGARAFVIRYGEPRRDNGQLVIFPANDAGFSDDEATAIIDLAISPDLRGKLQRHYLAAHDAEPAPYRLGRDELRSYASGANITLVGSDDGPGWQRIDISAGRLADRWDPWHW